MLAILTDHLLLTTSIASGIIGCVCAWFAYAAYQRSLREITTIDLIRAAVKAQVNPADMYLTAEQESILPFNPKQATADLIAFRESFASFRRIVCAVNHARHALELGDLQPAHEILGHLPAIEQQLAMTRAMFEQAESLPRSRWEVTLPGMMLWKDMIPVLEADYRHLQRATRPKQGPLIS